MSGGKTRDENKMERCWGGALDIVHRNSKITGDSTTKVTVQSRLFSQGQLDFEQTMWSGVKYLVRMKAALILTFFSEKGPQKSGEQKSDKVQKLRWE